MLDRRGAVNNVAAVIGIFEQATAVRRRDDVRGGEVSPRSVFDAVVQPGWDIGGNANGGYLLAIAARAMSAVVDRPPLTVTAHYLAPAPEAPCTVEVRPVRVGRRMATVGATLRQGERAVLEVLGTFAHQADDPVARCDGGPPDLPAYEDCPAPLPAVNGPVPALVERLAVRMRPGDDGFRAGRPSGDARMAGWFAFADGAPIDAIGLLLAADAFAPPVFNTELPVAWVPTLELTVHVRGVPAPGPVACVFRTRFIHGGLLEEDGELWDVDGRLVAQCRQLALTPRS